MYDPAKALTELKALWAEATQTTKGYKQMAQPLAPTSKWYAAQQHYLAAVAALTPDAPPPPSTGRLLGFSSHVPSDPAKADAYVGMLAAAGAKLLRDDLAWSSCEPTKGVRNFGRADLICGLARKYGLKVVLQIGFAPAWANGGKQDKVGPLNPADFAAWAAACAAYLAAHWADVIVGVEYWNEPNIDFLVNPRTGVAGDAAYYAQLASAAYPAMKTAAPGIPAWAGSTSGVGSRVWNEPNISWTEDVLKLIGHSFDEWSCHPYYFTTGITAASAVRLDLSTGFSRAFWYPETLEQLLTRYGYDGPIHATEVGIPTDAYPSGIRINDGGFGTTSETVQADWFKAAWPLWTGRARAGHFCVYTGQDANSAATTTREDHFGAYRSDGAPKPIVAAMKAAA